MKTTAAMVWAVLTVSTLPAQDWFATTRVYGLDTGRFRTVADLDGDGDRDAVSINVNSFGSTLRAAFNDGRGEFLPGATVSVSGVLSTRVETGDVNGDGRIDAIVARPSASAVLVFPGVLPAGFASPASFAVPAGSEVAALADADADGDLDVLVIAPGGVLWATNAGGSFAAGPIVPGTTPAHDAAAADWNQDGRADIVVVHAGAGVSQLLSMASGYALASAVPHGLGASGFAEVRAGDFDADGRSDLIVLDVIDLEADLRFQVLFGQAGGGLVPGPLNAFPNHGAGALHPGDWDGDGIVDLVVANQSMSFFRGVGGGQFSEGFRIPLQGPESAYGSARGSELVDLDGDGDADFAGGLEVLYGTGSAESPQLPAGFLSARFADLDGDGDLDTFDSIIQGAAWGENDGSGSFAARSFQVASGFSSPFALAAPASTGMPADLDGDGAPEVLARLTQVIPPTPACPMFSSTVFIELRLLEQESGGRWADRGPAAAPGIEIGAGIAVDADGDGDRDLATAAGLWLNTGGFFVGPSALWPGWEPMAVADLDGDHDEDLVARADVPGTPVGTAVAVLRNAGGSFSVEVLSAGSAFTSGVPVPPIIADLSGDGLPDIAWTNGGSAAALVAVSVGSSFGFLLPLPGISGTLYANDVDRDGVLDLVTTGSPAAAPVLQVHRSPGPWMPFEAPRRFQARYLLGDLDGDGDLEAGFSQSLNPSGSGLVRGRTWIAPASGYTRQYGQGVAGSGAFVPLLGASGPVRAGRTVDIRLRDGAGGAPAILAVGLAEAAIPDFPLPGLTSYNFPWALLLPLMLGGAPGVPGAGALDILAPMPPEFAGLSFFLQLAVLDAGAATGLSVSGGLELHVGN